MGNVQVGCVVCPSRLSQRTHIHAFLTSRNLMNFTVLFFDALALLWQALSVAIRLLRWLISQYFEARKTRGVFFPNNR